MARKMVHGDEIAKHTISNERYAWKLILMSDGVVLQSRGPGRGWKKAWRFEKKLWAKQSGECLRTFCSMELEEYLARCRAFETPSAAALRKREKEKARIAEIVAMPKKVPSNKFECALAGVAETVKEACEKSLFGFIPNSYLYLALKMELGSYYAFLRKLQEWDPCVVVTSETIKYLGVGGH